MGDSSIFFLTMNFEPLIILHPFTTYITILLHMQADFILNFWCAADGSNRQRKAAMLHVSVSATIQVLLFGLNTWVSNKCDLGPGWTLGWHFPNVMQRQHTFPSLRNSCVNALVWISCYLILYHIVALGISLWANFRTSDGLDAGGAEITLENRG